MAGHSVKLNKHVTYYDLNRRPRPGTIVAVTSQSVVSIRIASSRTVISAASKGSRPKAANTWQHK